MQIIKITGGTSIGQACQRAVEQADLGQEDVAFDFNDTRMVAVPGGDPAALASKYMSDAAERRRVYEESEEYKTSVENCTREEAERRKSSDELLSTCKDTFELADPELWETMKTKNTDAMGLAILSFAERWARMMEARMEKWQALKLVAEECSELADTEGISGSMWGCARNVLVAVWKHGPELKDYYKKY